MTPSGPAGAKADSDASGAKAEAKVRAGPVQAPAEVAEPDGLIYKRPLSGRGGLNFDDERVGRGRAAPTWRVP